jgi:7,8-dihydropterin-6-yl-methyl-4-(beta-D-ribofuranosyl)aminobenzene 5'-phosphate synthase
VNGPGSTDGPGPFRVTILVDNEAATGLLPTHGFAAWVEVAGRHLLFDTGQPTALEVNAARLGIDLGRTDVLVLSHGHYDHTGGLASVVARARGMEVFAHPAAVGPHYSVRQGIARSIAMPAPSRQALESLSAGVRWTTETTWLSADVGLSGPIPRRTGYEDVGGPFFLDPQGNAPDPLPDDLALWVRTARGLVVLVGCCHAGVVNTARHALEVSGEERLHAILGGFHLSAASEERLARTLTDLAELNPDLIVPCHCTGKRALQRLAERFGERVVPGFAGAVHEFPARRPTILQPNAK